MKPKTEENSPKFAQFCEFNVLVDVREVVSGLAVNITDMMRTGVVKDSSSTLDNNGIDDPNQVIGLVRDEFAAIDAMRAIRKYGKKNKAAQQKAVEQATVVAAPAPSGE